MKLAVIVRALISENKRPCHKVYPWSFTANCHFSDVRACGFNVLVDVMHYWRLAIRLFFNCGLNGTIFFI